MKFLESIDKHLRIRYIYRMILIGLGDIVSVAFSYLFALWIHYDLIISNVPVQYIRATLFFIPVVCITTVLVYQSFRLYQSIWEYVSVTEAWHIILSYIILGVLIYIENLVPLLELPRSVLFTGFVYSGIFCVIIRFGYRLVRYMFHHEGHKSPYQTLVVGAGQSARDIIKDIAFGRHPEYKIRAIVDDNPWKQGRFLEGIRIVGDRNAIPELVKKYHINTIIYAISEASGQDKKEILNICKETGCKIQIVPSLYRIISGQMNVPALRDVRIEDLLGRDEMCVNNIEILHDITGKTVLVTGGGGSIGSELCRQIARAKPKLLIIFDIYENNAYAVQQELRKEHPELNLVVLIGSIRDEHRLNSIMEKYRPDIVYHAAAHKHVPLMEENPCEAVKNNVLGTYKVALAAQKYGVKTFVLISTDKAVNPTNIMGASKRLCEMIIQSFAKRNEEYVNISSGLSMKRGEKAENSLRTAANKQSLTLNSRLPNSDKGTVFSSVRFGNVLGSNGSVIPIFKRQIAEGGPVTVTHKDVIRYFMTIPEAVMLILQAAHYAKGGEIFVLDMGKPIKIDDMARDLIKLSGYTPDKDIKIVYTGLRPGEKLYEELLMDEEGLRKTRNDLIYIGHPIADFNDSMVEAAVTKLEMLASNESDKIKEAVAEVVHTYKLSRKEEEKD